MVIKYQMSVTLAGNLRIKVEQFLKMATEKLFLSVVGILKPLNSKFDHDIHLNTLTWLQITNVCWLGKFSCRTFSSKPFGQY